MEGELAGLQSGGFPGGTAGEEGSVGRKKPEEGGGKKKDVAAVSKLTWPESRGPTSLFSGGKDRKKKNSEPAICHLNHKKKR